MKEVYYNPKLPGILKIEIDNFFDDVVLSPGFYKPENYELEITTHNSIRYTLFYDSLKKVIPL